MIQQEDKKIIQIKNAMKYAFPHTIPVMTGFLVLGMAYGVLMQANGYGTLWAVLMSGIAFCGSMQFVAVSLLTSPFQPVEAFLLSLMVNARHLFYGISMLDRFKGLGKVRLFLIYTLCDETFSISSSVQAPDGIDRRYFYFSISLLNYIYWVFATFLGGILGSFITMNTKGLDFVLTALFVVLFMEQMKTKENHTPGIIGILCSIVSLIIFGPNGMVIPAMIFILFTLLVRRKALCT
ncbi:AzlC family ABC transporter permease [Anaerotignum sp. MB30-C6]|uniref:AzlC family ABC transporter permease n=1 Tax=Anaerotignum sp. MB30-C6 TaxID=3070814 RepID=UPI0027DB1109|nr:AzlC family ABC transporter permease [Anaerotignum sp. MB30-C6]WMI81241.1 AzlC family ABC transporter permease [Anaerotignum sp. MB30-C6]